MQGAKAGWTEKLFQKTNEYNTKCKKHKNILMLKHEKGMTYCLYNEREGESGCIVFIVTVVVSAHTKFK